MTPTGNPADAISGFYQTELGRTPDTQGLQHWTDLYTSGRMGLPEIQAAINASPEGTAFDARPASAVAAFGPPAGAAPVSSPAVNPAITFGTINTEQDAFNTYAGLRNQGFTDADIRAAANAHFGAQRDTDWDYLRNQAASLITAPVDDITKFYQTELGRTPEAEGLGHWSRLYQTGQMTLPEIQAAINASPEGVNFDQLFASAQSQFAPAEGGALDLAALNKGFEWAQANKLSDDTLKRALGEDTYNAYAKQYGEGIMQSLQPALDDGKLTAQEALDVVTRAKQYGLDADEIAKYTGLDERVPQAFFNTYDKVLTGIVGNAFDPKVEVPEGDRVKTLLALQSKYGLTDKDIASYSGGKASEQAVKDYVAPVRNFQDNFQSVFNNPNATAKDIVDFIDKSRTNAGVSAVYGDKLNELEQSGKLAEVRRLADVGMVRDARGQEYNPMQLMRLAQQIGERFNSGISSGGAFGTRGDSMGFRFEEVNRMLGKEANAPTQVMLDMARSLMEQGVTDINQIKLGTTKEQTHYHEDESGQRTYTTPAQTGLMVGDKLLPTTFGKTTAGKGYTRYNMYYDPETGGPKFATQGKSNLPGWVAPALSLAGAFVGAPMLGSLLASTGIGALASGTLLNTALSRGILSGITSDLLGGNFSRGLVGGAISPVVGAGVGSLLPTDMNPIISNAIKGTAGNVASTAVRGGDVGQALTGGILGGALNYALDPVIKGMNLSPAGEKLLTGIAIPGLVSGQINPYGAAGTLASIARKP